MKQTKAELASYIVARHSELAGARGPWDTVWQELAEFFLPQRAEISSRKGSPDTSRNDVLFDSSGLQAAATMANGQLAYITPADSRWFVYEPPAQLKDVDKANQWYQRCSEVVQMVLATSNFYSEIHELYYDDTVFGTYAMTVRAGRSHPLVFSKRDCGSYCIAEDDEGLIDTIYLDVEMTISQAVDEFGEENLSEKLRKHYEVYKKTGKGGTEKFLFIHAIYPRSIKDRDLKKADGPNKPWASVYVEKITKHVCRVSGFDEKPFFAGRHDKSSHGVYGVSPAWRALPEARQLNFLSKQLDALAEVKAFPRMLMPATHEGEIDLRAGGVTYYDPQQPNAIPREWAAGGEYQIGLERENRKAGAIDRAFHVDMFRMFASLDKQMTAREVSERASEKLAQFSPSFARKTTELLTPMLRACFGIMLRNGQLPPPPPEAQVQDASGVPFIALPDISYVSRVALAIRAMHNLSWSRSLERNMVVAQIRPEILDNFNFDRIVRDTSRNDGLPADWLMEDDEIQSIRKARAEAQAKAQQEQQMLMAAEAMGKAGGVKKDSMIAEQMKQMA